MPPRSSARASIEARPIASEVLMVASTLLPGGSELRTARWTSPGAKPNVTLRVACGAWLRMLVVASLMIW